MEDADPEVYNHVRVVGGASLFNSQKLLSVPCWTRNEERTATVMKVVNVVGG